MDNDNSKLTNSKKRKLLSESMVDDNNNNNNNSNISIQTTTLHHQQEQWFHHEEDSLMIYALSFLDVKSLLQKETVSKTWRKLSKLTLRNKCCGRPKAFQSHHEILPL
jgi:hypothetical protein